MILFQINAFTKPQAIVGSTQLNLFHIYTLNPS